MAHFFPGLPDLRSLSPADIAAYVVWRHDSLNARPTDGEEWGDGD